MTNKDNDLGVDLIRAEQARRAAAGLKVTTIVNDGAGQREFTAYAKDAEQAARWRAQFEAKKV